MATTDKRRLRIAKYKAKIKLAEDQITDLNKKVFDIIQLIVWAEENGRGTKKHRISHAKVVIKSFQTAKDRLEKFIQIRQRDIETYKTIIDNQLTKIPEMKPVCNRNLNEQ